MTTYILETRHGIEQFRQTLARMEFANYNEVTLLTMIVEDLGMYVDSSKFPSHDLDRYICTVSVTEEDLNLITNACLDLVNYLINVIEKVIGDGAIVNYYSYIGMDGTSLIIEEQ